MLVVYFNDLQGFVPSEVVNHQQYDTQKKKTGGHPDFSKQ